MAVIPPRRYEAPTAASAGVRVCEGFTIRPDVRFTIVTAAEAEDPLSGELASGVLPETYGPLIDLLVALTPKGGRVLDLGTHVGTFTLSAAALGYEVVGVEASPRNASLLRSSLERNGFEHRVRLIHAAVSDRPGTLSFCQAGPYGHVATAGGPSNATVPALAVDDLLDELGWDRIDFIKMDIEGSEVVGLRGLARRLRRADAPPVFVESNGHTLAMFGQTPATLKKTLEGFGYRNFQVENGSLRPVRRGALQPGTVVDYLAIKGGESPKIESAGRAWRVDPPMTRHEVVMQVVDSARSRNPAERGYIARALAGAPADLLAVGPVAEAVNALKADEGEAVRTAADAIRMPSALRAWVAAKFDRG